MGIAEVIPGVSGGTIALITGIYEKLINTIKSFDLELLRNLIRFRFSAVWEHINGPFLTALVAGMLAGIVVGVFGVTHLMEHYPEELWGFFFGLILASALYVGRSVPKWGGRLLFIAILGALIAFLITQLVPAQGSGHLAYVFLSGAVAVCALILPGISGSFILLLLGMYTVVIPALKELLSAFDTSQLLLLAVFGLGCVTGLATISRVLSWMFRRYHDATLALLTGFMIGSLSKIWPWRNPIRWMDETGAISVTPLEGDGVRIIAEQNVPPAMYEVADPNTLMVVVCGIAGFAIVLILARVFGSLKPGSRLQFD